jgi:hypothetical protein
VQVSTIPTFTTTVTDQSGITETSHALSNLDNNTIYYWRVNATNEGGTSTFSDTRSFTTIVEAPPAPTLDAPADSATGISVSPTLSWNASGGATSYQVQVSTIPMFTTTVTDQSGITGTSHALSNLDNNTLYYWRVNATNAGGTSAYSDTRNFTTRPALAIANPFTIPTLTDPSRTFLRDLHDPPLISGNVGTLSFSASIDNPDIAEVTISNDTLIVSRKATGSTMVHVVATDAADDTKITHSTSLGVVTTVEQRIGGIPIHFALDQNYPNPFNPSTSIRFSVQHTGRAILRAFDLLGREARILFDAEAEAGRMHQTVFDGADLTSGLYFIRLESGEQVAIRKVLLLK